VVPKATHGRKGEAGYNVLVNGTVEDTLGSQTISTQLQQIAQQAADYPDTVLTTLAHKIDTPLYSNLIDINHMSKSVVPDILVMQYNLLC